MSRKVLVTGLGATTPIGGDVPTTWANATKGVSGVSTLDYPWVKEYDLPVYIAGQLAVPALDSGRLTKVEAKRLDPSGQLALIAARGVWVPWGSCLGRVRTGRRSRGSAPSAALGRLEDGAPASRDRLRCWGSSPSAAPQQRLIQAP